MKLHKAQLFDYGIQNEDSHIRAHVCPQVKRVYIYPTSEGIRALSNGREAYGYQPGVAEPTAKGYLVEPFKIGKCLALQINNRVWEHFKFQENETTTEKGRKAVKLVVSMIKEGLFPLPTAIIANADLSKNIQVKGDDVIVWTQKACIKIQVKCDFRGGEKQLGGTGYLYLQTAERNPLKYF